MQSPIDETTPHHAFIQGDCSAYGALAKENENWTTISNRAERRRVQNRIAQRTYRKKLKDRLQLLERRAAQLSSPASSSEPHQRTFNDERCYPHMPSNASTYSKEHCPHCSGCRAASRHATACPPTSCSTSLTHSPDMPYYQVMQRQYPIYHTSETLQMAPTFTTEAPQHLELNVSYLQSYVDDTSTMKFEYDGLPSPFMDC